MKFKNIMGNKDYIEHVDYYLEDGRVYFTEKYLKERGSCCGIEHCRHCPYTNKIKNNAELKK
jgi:hypothetical protein